MKMRQARRFASTVLCLFALAQNCAAQAEKARLRYSFSPGQKLTVVSEETSDDSEENFVAGSKSHTVNTKEIVQAWDVSGVTAEGDYRVNVKFTRLRTVRSIAPGVDLGLDTRRTVSETNPILAQMGPQGTAVIEKLETFRKLMTEVFMSRSFRFVITSLGTVKSVSGFDQAWENYRLKVADLVSEKTKRAELDALIETFFGEESVHKLFSYTLLVAFPAEPVSVGREWSDATEFVYQTIHLPIKRHYRLTSFSGQGKVFVIDGKIMFDPPTSTEEIEFKVP